MVNLHLRRDEEGDPRARISSMAHLQHASKDINDYRFEKRRPPAEAAKSCDHVFVAIDKTTGIESEWPMDSIVDVDEHGSFETEWKRIIGEFATWLQHLDASIKLARAKQAQEGQRLALPKNATAAQAARALLLKGDHPQ